MEDFKSIYYGSRTLLEHRNPYSPHDVLDVYLQHDGERGADPSVLGQRQGITVNVYLPPTLLCLAPIALLPWGPAHIVWLALTAGFLILAAYLAWDLQSHAAPTLSGALAGALLANAFGVLLVGNAAGVVIGLTITGAWCLINEKRPWIGITCLAIALMIKPHDAGFIWLFLVLAGGSLRKHALQSLALSGILSLPAVLWVHANSPHWFAEQKANMVVASGPLGRDNPGPSSLGSHTAGMIVDLQTVFSVFKDDSRYYNLASYIVVAIVLLCWFAAFRRWRPTKDGILLALASLSALTMLPTYHRVYDTRLLLLTIPACALLWVQGGVLAWSALAVTSLGIFLTGDLVLVLLVRSADRFHLATASTTDKLLLILVERPLPLILLLVACFYLWAYARLSGGNNSAYE